MKTIGIILLALLLPSLAACGPEGTAKPQGGAASSPLPAVSAQPGASSETEPGTALTLVVGDRTFTVTLEENDAARSLAELLPMTLDMSELNGNEKFFYLDSPLPTDSETPGQIHTGDLMLYGNDCLVLFYGSFSSGYSYTRLGCVTEPEGLAEALGAGSVTVSFALAE